MKKKILSIIIGCVILLLMLDGFCDFLLYSKPYIGRFFACSHFLASLPEGADHTFYKKIFDNTRNIEYVDQPFIGKTIKPGAYGFYSIDSEGKRVNIDSKDTSSRPQKLLLLGASQAFGSLSEDHDSLAFSLSQLLPDYEIDNYSVPGQTTLKTLAYWQKVSTLTPKHYDLAIILSGPLDYLHECRAMSERKFRFDQYEKPAIYSVPQMIINKFFTKKNPFKNLCSNPEQQIFVADQVVKNLQSLIKYGESQDIKTLAFIPPTLWGNSANITSLKPFLFSEEVKIFNKIQKEISRNASFEKKIIDLSHAFDSEEQELFLDEGAHFTPKGNRIISLEIAEYLNR